MVYGTAINSYVANYQRVHLSQETSKNHDVQDPGSLPNMVVTIHQLIAHPKSLGLSHSDLEETPDSQVPASK